MSLQQDSHGRAAPTVRGDVAIVGMACLFPGAPDLATYWQNIISKEDAITDPLPEAWDADVFYDPASTANDRVYCKRGGFLGPLTHFDPLAHGVMPLTTQGSEPDQWLALRVARDALTDAGYGDEIPERHRTAVILGKGAYLNHGNCSVIQHGTVVDQTLKILHKLHPELSEADLELLRADLKRDLPPFNANTVPGLIPNITVGRIANRLDLMGPSYTVDAACASSLVAVDMAIRELLTHQCDLALVGGVHVVTPVPVLMVFCHLNALSRREQIRPFDKDADGTILGEGLGMVVLKRCEDAERDGHRIYATIKGTGIASDGRGMSVMAPRLEGELLALQRAYESSGLEPRSVGLIEAHGTGTPVGDMTEVEALSRVFGQRDGSLPSCALGSVKSMIGHLMPAAGIAALIKTALALYHQVRPPTLNVDEPNAQLALDTSPFYLNTETRPWIHNGCIAPRRAGVNAFGFGGINAHVILEEAPDADNATFQSHIQRWDTEVYILSAGSRLQLMQRGQKLQQFLSDSAQSSPKDLAYTLNVPLDSGPARLAIVAASREDLQQKLDRALHRLADPQCHTIKDVEGIYYFEQSLLTSGRLAFLFPGEGAQYVNMLADLCIHFPEVRKRFDFIDSVVDGHSRSYLPSDIIFPPTMLSESDRMVVTEGLWRMEGAVEAVLTANHALFHLLSRLEIHPDVMVGHSTGEYSAMFATGMINLDDDVRMGQFAQELNRIHQQAVMEGDIPHVALLAVGAGIDTVLAVTKQIEGEVYVAMDNCPHQTVIVGEQMVIERAVEQFRQRGVICEHLPFDRPYHTPLFKAFATNLRVFFDRWLVSPPQVQTYSCPTISPFSTDMTQIQNAAVEHWMRPVEFRQTIEAMYADNVRLFVEVGPRGNLTAFVNDILRNRSHLAVPANVMNRSGITQLNHLVGLLAAQNVPMRLDYLYAHRAPTRLELDRSNQMTDDGQTPNRHIKLATGWPWMEMSEETAAHLQSRLSTTPTVPPPSDLHIQTQAAPAAEPVSQDVGSSVDHREAVSIDQVVSANLHTMERFLAVQQEIMKAFLTGQTAAPPAAATLPPSVPPSSQRLQATMPTPTPREDHQTPLRVETSPSPNGMGEEQPATVQADGHGAATTADLLLQLISERTGYPTEMLALNLDLEADLGIDSIKRVEILGSFQQQTGLLKSEDMEGLSSRRTLQDVLDFFAVPPAASETVSPLPLPFVETIVALKTGELAARCEIDLDKHLFLRDHTLGRQISLTDPTLSGLPVMPLTMSMEMLAEAAATLAPGKCLVGMQNIRTYRWIALEEQKIALELIARRNEAAPGYEIDVKLYEANAAGESRNAATAPIVEGTMVFGETYPEPPPMGPFILQQETVSKWMPQQLYDEGMFHGPAFRGTVSIDRCGTDGSVATLKTLPDSDLFRSRPAHSLLTDPVLLDQPGQVVGFWTAEHLESDYVIFPFRLETLHFYGPKPEMGTYLTCQARIHLVEKQQVRSDLDIVRQDGRVWARFIGWEDRRFDLPTPFFRFMLAPGEIVLSEAWPLAVAALPNAGAWQACRLGLDVFPEGFFTAHGGIWRRVFAYLVLSRRERALWHGLNRSEKGCTEWLLGRVVAKDAVRRYLKQQYGMVVYPADIEILPEENGRSRVQGAWSQDVPSLPLLSLSHSEGVALAIVGNGDTAASIGVEIEHMGRVRAGTEKREFTPRELALLSSVPHLEQDHWLLRLWCAKEAVAKALELSVAGGLQALVIEALDAQTGAVQVALTGELAQRLPAVDSRSLVVYTAEDHDLVVATSLYV
jgi:phosphopantetheine--protein transferase-like protein